MAARSRSPSPRRHRIRQLPPEACATTSEALSQAGLPTATERYPECAGGN